MKFEEYELVDPIETKVKPLKVNTPITQPHSDITGDSLSFDGIPINDPLKTTIERPGPVITEQPFKGIPVTPKTQRVQIPQATTQGQVINKEESWPKVVGKSIMGGLGQIGTGVMGTVKAGLDIAGIPVPEIGLLAKDVGEYWQPEVGDSTAKKYGAGIAQSMAGSLPLMLTGPAALPLFGVTSGGNKYLQMRDAGQDIKKSLAVAVPVGISEAVTELLPLRAIMKPGSSIIKRMLSSAALEVPGEEINTLVESVADKLTIKPNMTMHDYWSDFIDTAVITIGQSFLTAGLMHPVIKHEEKKQAERDIEQQIKTEGKLQDTGIKTTESTGIDLGGNIDQEYKDRINAVSSGLKTPEEINLEEMKRIQAKRAGPLDIKGIIDQIPEELPINLPINKPSASSIDSGEQIDKEISDEINKAGIEPQVVSPLTEMPETAPSGISPLAKYVANANYIEPALPSIPIANEIDQKAHEAATSTLNEIPQPTEPQKEAGNYQKGHIKLQGLDISIENPEGSTRSGISPEGKKWESTLASHYGYIRGTEGKDKDHIDTFIGKNPESNQVFVANQIDPKTKKFDEHKILLGYNSLEEAQKGYLANYEPGWKGLGSIVPMSMEQFKGWLDKGDTKKEVKATEGIPLTRMSAEEAETPQLRQPLPERAGLPVEELQMQTPGISETITPTGETKEGIPDHVTRAIETQREVPESVITKTKQENKKNIQDHITKGDIDSDNFVIRMTDHKELGSILKNGMLMEGTDFEGRSGISAQDVSKNKPIVGYGNGISVGIVIPKNYVIGKGVQPNEVKIDPKVPIGELRFTIDGLDGVYTADEVKEQLKAKASEVEVAKAIQGEAAITPNEAVNDITRSQMGDRIAKGEDVTEDIKEGIRKHGLMAFQDALGKEEVEHALRVPKEQRADLAKKYKAVREQMKQIAGETIKEPSGKLQIEGQFIETGKNVKDFKQGDHIEDIYTGAIYEVIEPDKKGMAKIRVVSPRTKEGLPHGVGREVGKIEDINAGNNPHFIEAKKPEPIRKEEVTTENRKTSREKLSAEDKLKQVEERIAIIRAEKPESHIGQVGQDQELGRLNEVAKVHKKEIAEKIKKEDEASDKYTLSIERVNQPKFTVKKGDTVSVWFSKNKSQDMEIIGISKAKNEVKVKEKGAKGNGIWVEMARVYPVIKTAEGTKVETIKEQGPKAEDIQKEISVILPPIALKEMWDRTPGDEKARWDEATKLNEDLEKRFKKEIDALKDELKALQGKGVKERRQEVYDRIDELRNLAALPMAKAEEDVIERQNILRDAIEKEAEKEGIEDDLLEGFSEEYFEIIDPEGQDIEATYNKTHKQLFDELIKDYKEKMVEGEGEKKEETKTPPVAEKITTEKEAKQPTTFPTGLKIVRTLDNYATYLKKQNISSINAKDIDYKHISEFKQGSIDRKQVQDMLGKKGITVEIGRRKPVAKKAKKEYKDFISWVQSKGGINYNQEKWKGELDALRESKGRYSFIIKKNNNGLTLDELAIMAKDEGFIKEATPQAVLDALKGQVKKSEVTETEIEKKAEPKDVIIHEDEPVTKTETKEILKDAGNEKTQTSLKEQKTYLLSEIDTLLVNAPDDEETLWGNRILVERRIKTLEEQINAIKQYLPKENQEEITDKEKIAQEQTEGYSNEIEKLQKHIEMGVTDYNTVKIDVPGDGTFEIINTKDKLKEFKGMVEKNFPIAETSTVKRVSIARLTSSAERAKPISSDELMIGEYKGNTWQSNGNFLLKGEPKLKPSGKGKPNRQLTDKMIENVSSNKATLKGTTEEFFFKDPDTGEGRSEKPIKDEKARVLISNRADRWAVIDQTYYNYIKAHYPNAKFFLKDSDDVNLSPLVIIDGKELVGLVMPIRYDIEDMPSQLKTEVRDPKGKKPEATQEKIEEENKYSTKKEGDRNAVNVRQEEGGVTEKNSLPNESISGRKGKQSPEGIVNEGVELSEKRESYGISRKDFEDMIARQWNTVREYYRDDGIITSKEYLNKIDSDTIALEIDSNYELYNRYLKNIPEEVNLEDVINAYKKGELPETVAAKGKTEVITVPSKVEAEPIGNLGEPIAREKLKNPKSTWGIATQRVTKDNEKAVMKARYDIFMENAFHKDLAERLGIEQKEINRRIKAWSNTPIKAFELQKRTNAEKDIATQWHGITNSAFLSRRRVLPKDVKSFVKSVEAKDKGWMTITGDALRNYISRALLGIDTRILFKDLTFRVESTLKPRGQYKNTEKLITIRESSPHTVAHEIGHYLDYKWAEEAYEKSMNPASNMMDTLVKGVISDKTSDLREQWMNRFHEFVMDISERSDIGSEYYQSRGEVFARFVSKFVDWTNTQAGMRSWGGDSYVGDKFYEGDYLRFISLLQEKAYVDIADGNPLSKTGRRIEGTVEKLKTKEGGGEGETTERTGSHNEAMQGKEGLGQKDKLDIVRRAIEGKTGKRLADGSVIEGKRGEGLTGVRWTGLDTGTKEKVARLEREKLGKRQERVAAGSIEGVGKVDPETEIGKVAKIFGKDVVIVHINRPDLVSFEAITNLNDTSTIFISDRADTPILSLIGHEMFHTMGKDEPGLAEDFARIVGEQSIEGFPDYARDYKISHHGEEITTELIAEEFSADIMGTQFSKESFWKQLSQKEPSLFERLAKYVVNFLKNVRERFVAMHSTEFLHIRDIDKITNAASTVMAEYAKKQQAIQPFKTIGGESEQEGARKPWLDGETVTDLGNDTEGLGRLREKLSAFERRRFDVDSISEISVRGENSTIIKKIAKEFGKEVRFFRTQEEILSGYNGLSLPSEPNLIWLNVDSRYPHLQVLGHELMHILQNDDPALWNAFYKVLQPEIKNYGKFKEIYQRAGAYHNGEQLIREFTSEFLGQKFMDEKFWQGMSEKHPTLFQKIISYVKNLLDKLTGKAFERDIDNDFLRDIEKARQIAIDTMATYAKRQGKSEGKFYQGGEGYDQQETGSKYKRSMDEDDRARAERLGMGFQADTKGRYPTGGIQALALPEDLLDLRKITDAFGKKLVFVHNYHPEIRSFEGASVKGYPETIFLSDTANDKPIAIIGHELMHTMRMEQPALFDSFMESIKGEVRSIEQFYRKYQQSRGSTNDYDYMAEEFGADLIGNRFTEESFWKSLSQKEPNIFERVYSFVMKFIDNLRSKLSIMKYTDTYIKDLDKIRRVASDVMSEYSRFQGKSFSISEPSQPFYSKLEMVVTDKMPNRATPTHLMNILNKEVKTDEIKETGLDEFLKGKRPTGKWEVKEEGNIWRVYEDGIQRAYEFSSKDKANSFIEKEGGELKQPTIVTKQEVLDYIKANKVEVERVTKGEPLTLPSEYSVKQFPIIAYDKGKWITTESKEWFVIDKDGRKLNEFGHKTKRGAINNWFTHHPDTLAAGRMQSTSFDNPTYRLPGGDEGTYREEFLTLPKIKEVPTISHEVRDSIGRPQAILDTKEQAQHYIDRQPNNKGWKIYTITNKPRTWQDGHSQYADVVNPIVRLRYDERTLPDGSKVGTVYEFQPPSPENQAKMPEWVKKRWRELGAKHMMRIASERGWANLTWATGEQVAGFYDISKHADSVAWTSWPSLGEGKGILSAYKDNQEVIKKTISESELPDYVGKEVSKKLLEQVPETLTGRRMLIGQELSIGGLGLKRIYDQDMVNVFNSLGKKYGVKVGDENIPTREVKLRVDSPKEQWPSRGEIKTRLKAIIENKNAPVTDERVAKAILNALNNDSPIDIALENHGNIAIGDYLGIEMSWSRDVDTSVHSLPITDQMINDVLYKGQPLFQVSKEESPKLKLTQDQISDLIREAQRIALRIAAPGTQVRFEDKLTADATDISNRNSLERWGKGDYSGTVTLKGKHEIKVDITGENFISMITYSLSAMDEKVMYHEPYHSAYDLLLSESEKKFMDGEHPSKNGVHTVEMQAIAFSDYAVRKRKGMSSKVRLIFAKIKNFFVKLKNYLNSKGFHSIEDIFEKAYAGKYAKERAKEIIGKGQIPSYSILSQKQTDTPEFKGWFGNSVVTENGKPGGNPMVVYHGTIKEFSTFNFKKGLPYFTNRSEIADRFSGGKSGEQYGRNIKPVYLKIERPLKPSQFALDFGGNVNKAEAGGYDGEIDKLYTGEVRFRPFRPNQIKSATGNIGTFDPNNPDISFSIDNETITPEDAMKSDKSGTSQFLNDIIQKAGGKLDPRVTNYMKKDLSWINKIINTPKYIAYKFKEFLPVFKGAQAIYQYRDDNIADLMVKVKDYMDLDKASRDKVDIIAEHYTLKNEIPKNDDLKAGTDKLPALNDKEIRALWSLKDTYNSAFKKIIETYVEMGGDKADISKEMGRIKFYVPLSRFGEWAVTWSDPKQSPLNNYLDKPWFNTLRDAYANRESLSKVIESIPKDQQKEFKAAFKLVHQDKTGLQFETFESELKAKAYANQKAKEGMRVSFDKMVNIAKGTALEGLDMYTLSALARFADINPDIADPFLMEAKEFLKTRGIMKHFVERKSTPGYSTDWVRVHADYIVGVSNYLARVKGIKSMKEGMEGINPKKTPDLYKYAQDYINYIENPREEAAKLRGGLFLYYLGGNVKSAVLNLTQTITTAWPWLSQYSKLSSLQLSRAGKDVLKGIKFKNGAPYFDSTHLGDELSNALDSAVETTNEQMVYEMMATSRGAWLTKQKSGQLGDALSKSIRALSYMFGTAETWNRRVTFIAAFRIGKELEAKGKLPKEFESVHEFARQAVENSQFVYGRYQRNTISRGPIGATFFTFKSFTLQYIEMLSRLAKQDKKSFFKALSIMLVLAGAAGLPFMDDLKKLWEKMTGTNLDAKARDISNEILGDPRYAEVMLRGITRLGPVDMSGAIGLGDIVPEIDTISILGPAGGILQRIAKAMPYTARHEYLRALETISPEAIRNPLTAYRIAKEGHRDIRGQMIFSGKGRYGRELNVAAKALGFYPSDLARAQERERAQAMIGGRRGEKKKAFVDRMARAIVDKDIKEIKNLRQEIKDYNADEPKERRIAISAIDVRNAVRRLRLPEDVSGMKYKSKQERSEYQRMRDLFK